MPMTGNAIAQKLDSRRMRTIDSLNQCNTYTKSVWPCWMAHMKSKFIPCNGYVQRLAKINWAIFTYEVARQKRQRQEDDSRQRKPSHDLVHFVRCHLK